MITVCFDAAGRRYATKGDRERKLVEERAYTRRLEALARALDKPPRNRQIVRYFGCASLSDAQAKVRALLAKRAEERTDGW